MPDQPDISLVIPAFNEAARIEATLDEARAYLARRGLSREIVVVADGADGTREIVARLAESDPTLAVLGTSERRGKGRGVRDGVARARGRWVGFADADNKTPIDELDKFLPLLEAGREVVIGSRRHAESSIERRQPLVRRLGSRGFNACLHLLIGLRDVPDTQCGFKFFQGAVAHDLFSHQRIDGYMFDVELLYLASRRGYRIDQVPVRWRDDGDSRLELFRGNLRNLRDVLAIRFGPSDGPGEAALDRSGGHAAERRR